MRFSWDRAKSEVNQRKRGFDFAFASPIFDGPILMVEDSRRDCGEQRFVAIGVADGLHLTVVFTDREGKGGRVTRRIISARRSNERERQHYGKIVG